MRKTYMIVNGFHKAFALRLLLRNLCIKWNLGSDWIQHIYERYENCEITRYVWIE